MKISSHVPAWPGPQFISPEISPVSTGAKSSSQVPQSEVKTSVKSDWMIVALSPFLLLHRQSSQTFLGISAGKFEGLQTTLNQKSQLRFYLKIKQITSV